MSDLLVTKKYVAYEFFTGAGAPEFTQKLISRLSSHFREHRMLLVYASNACALHHVVVDSGVSVEGVNSIVGARVEFHVLSCGSSMP